jgi:hypothetical protein
VEIKYKNEVELACGDYQKLPLNPESFDLVTTNLDAIVYEGEDFFGAYVSNDGTELWVDFGHGTPEVVLYENIKESSRILA